MVTVEGITCKICGKYDKAEAAFFLCHECFRSVLQQKGTQGLKEFKIKKSDLKNEH